MSLLLFVLELRENPKPILRKTFSLIFVLRFPAILKTTGNFYFLTPPPGKVPIRFTFPSEKMLLKKI